MSGAVPMRQCQSLSSDGDGDGVLRCSGLGALQGQLYRSFSPSQSLAEFHRGHSALVPEKGQKSEQQVEAVAGRITGRREASRKLVFYDVEQDGASLQVVSSLQHHSEGADHFATLHGTLRRGDIIGVKGFPGRTKTGELSIYSKEVQLLAPCMHNLPTVLRNHELKYGQRYLDMLANPTTIQTFQTRSRIIAFLRRWLDNRGFIEVETPTLTPSAGGAAATPFVTHAKAIGANLYLRVAPELYLKQLVVGGLHKVYEIGKQFRDEGVDSTHNPEFTTCEFYCAYTDYKSLMTLTEHFLRDLVLEVTGKTSIEAFGGAAGTIQIDFDKPFRCIDINTELQKSLGKSLPDFNSQASVPQLLELCKQHGVPVTKPHTPGRIVDKLIAHFIEPKCIQPTFVLHHPLSLSPLAKAREDEPGTAERFELFINRSEICNAYSELTSPVEQRERFALQQEYLAHGDKESHIMDEPFCTALEHGMPPTGGWGLGIDRLCMLLTGSTNIRDIIAFPVMKMHQHKSITNKDNH